MTRTSLTIPFGKAPQGYIWDPILSGPWRQRIYDTPDDTTDITAIIAVNAAEYRGGRAQQLGRWQCHIEAGSVTATAIMNAGYQMSRSKWYGSELLPSTYQDRGLCSLQLRCMIWAYHRGDFCEKITGEPF